MLEVTLGGIGKPATTNFFSIKKALWQGHCNTIPPSCPSVLAFEIRLPATYQGRDLKMYPLPPPCDISLSNGDPACSICCKYTLTFFASKTPRLVVLKRQKK